MLTEKTAKGKQSNEYMGYITLQCTLIPKTQDEKEQVIISKNLTFYILQSNGADMCNTWKILALASRINYGPTFLPPVNPAFPNWRDK